MHLEITQRLIVHCDGVDELADVSPGDASDANPARDARELGRSCVNATETSYDATETSVDATRMRGGKTSVCAKINAKKGRGMARIHSKGHVVGPPHENETLSTP